MRQCPYLKCFRRVRQTIPIFPELSVGRRSAAARVAPSRPLIDLIVHDNFNNPDILLSIYELKNDEMAEKSGPYKLWIGRMQKPPTKLFASF